MHGVGGHWICSYFSYFSFSYRLPVDTLPVLNRKKILITSKCPWNYAKNSMILNKRHFLIACHLKNKKTFYFVKNFVFKGTENYFWIPQDRNLLLLFLIFFWIDAAVYAETCEHVNSYIDDRSQYVCVNALSGISSLKKFSSSLSVCKIINAGYQKLFASFVSDFFRQKHIKLDRRRWSIKKYQKILIWLEVNS